MRAPAQRCRAAEPSPLPSPNRKGLRVERLGMTRRRGWKPRLQDRRRERGMVPHPRTVGALRASARLQAAPLAAGVSLPNGGSGR
jgi:hypothetical protein